MYFDHIIPPQLLPNAPTSQFIQAHVPSLLKNQNQNPSSSLLLAMKPALEWSWYTRWHSIEEN